MITIILTTYNMAEYLTQCVQSIINQTYKDLEIVIVDDGSTDGSAEILDGFQQADPRIKVIYQENKGHSEARNIGIENAHGEYYYFIDADDYIHERTIETLWNNMQETGAIMSIGGVTRKGELECNPGDGYYIYTPLEALAIVTDYHSGIPLPKLPFLATWNKLLKAGWFTELRFPSGHVHNDHFLYHKLLYRADRIVLSKSKTYFYRYKQHSISNDGLYKNKDLILATKDQIAFFKDKGLTQFLSDTCSYMLKVYLETYKAMNDYSVMEDAEQFLKDNQKYIVHNYWGEQHIEEINNILKG